MVIFPIKKSYEVKISKFNSYSPNGFRYIGLGELNMANILVIQKLY